MKGKVYKPYEELENKITVETPVTVISENRKDIQAMDESAAAYKKMFQSAKMGFLPRLNAFGNYLV